MPISVVKSPSSPGMAGLRGALAGDTAVHLVVSPEEALKELHSFDNKKYLKGLGGYWHQDEGRRVRAQSVCWLFCWGKTGMKSEFAARESRRIFDTILDIKISEFDEKVDHEWAKSARYKTEDIEQELSDLLK
jgi:hypothetical protein